MMKFLLWTGDIVPYSNKKWETVLSPIHGLLAQDERHLRTETSRLGHELGEQGHEVSITHRLVGREMRVITPPAMDCISFFVIGDFYSIFDDFSSSHDEIPLLIG